MRRRAPSQTWTLSRIHRVLRPLRTKVAALATVLRKERRSRPLSNTTAPTPTPTRLRPPLRRTYRTQRKRKRGDEVGSEEDGQYLPKTARVSKPRHKPSIKVERKWSPEVLERIAAVVDAFRVLADAVYDEQMETETGSSIISLKDMCIRVLAEDIEPSAVAAAGEESGSDDEGELVDATNVVDQRFEEIPEHLRRVAIIPYALSMIKQHIDTISPLPQLWDHILAICLSSSATPSATNSSDALQICSNLFLASLHQSRSASRGLASVYRKVTGTGSDKIHPETFCHTLLNVLTPPQHVLDETYTIPPQSDSPRQPDARTRVTRSPTRTPAPRRTMIPPTPPTCDPFLNDSDDPNGVLFPIRAFLSRPVAHLVAELGPRELLAFVEAAAVALLRWMQADLSNLDTGIMSSVRLRERSDVPQRKGADARSLAPRMCARLADWCAMALADVWVGSVDVEAVESAAVALGRVVDLACGLEGEKVEGGGGRAGSAWVDVGDPFCALVCMYLAKLPRESCQDGATKLGALLRRLPLTARNSNILAGTLGALPDAEDATERSRRSRSQSELPASPTSLAPTDSTRSTFIRALQTCTRAFASAKCPHLEATLLQVVLNERATVDSDIEEMLDDAEARWDQLESQDFTHIEPKEGSPEGEVDGWQWARRRWRWDEITNTWVEKSKHAPVTEFIPRRQEKRPAKAKGKSKEIITVSSDTEMGRNPEDDEDDVFAAIPTPKYAARYRDVPRRRSVGRRATYVSSDEDGGGGSDVTARPMRAARLRARKLPSFESETDDSDSYSSESETGSGSEMEESDFDWERYNGGYHPHDRSLNARSSSTSDRTRRDASRRSSTNTTITTRASRNNQENRVDVDVQAARPTWKPRRVVSNPIPTSAPAPVPAKRQRVVVEIPLFTKRIKNQVQKPKPTVLGNHNISRQDNFFSRPTVRSEMHQENQPAQRPPAKQVTTSTLSKLCKQFESLSSDDDREDVVMAIDVDEDEEVVEDSCGEDEVQRQRMDMPSSDDMDLFQIVTPVPRRVLPRGRMISRG
ncbi:hypothetical protein BDV93DRAFT_542352 [Ceratobasidium sp. AG-I]|nr:hypothetical protein BDV93DRAFT_542352 [Ceratobasidium sp. AG-I]